MGSPRHDPIREPIDRLRRLRLDERDQQALSDVLHELQVHQEELTAQNSQLIETQHALEESRDRFVDLYDFAPIGYMTITGGGMIREMNLTAAALLGRERGAILGLPFNGFVIPADKLRFSDHLRQCRDDNHRSAMVEVSLTTGTPPVRVQLVTRRFGSADEKPVFLTALIDVTERERLEKQRREAEDARDKLTRDREIARVRADAKDHFLAQLSHELRTPLTPIVATMSNDHLMSLAPQPLLAALQTARRNLDLEVQLIDDLLDVTRISRDRRVVAKERVNLHLVLQDVVEMLGEETRRREVRIVTTFNAPAEWVVGDSTRLRQVFWNLLGNAIKFTNAGGQVTVNSSEGPAGFVQITVTDTGIGMEKAVVDSINDTGDASNSMPIQASAGLGLGLVICRGVVQAHGGILRASSKGAGSGSTFIVQIPIAAHPEQWKSPLASFGGAEGVRKPVSRILLVEDHADSADMLSQLLTLSDYVVTVARSMGEAIAHASEHFDLVISDIRLPDGSGLELMQHLRARHPIRGIAISGYGTDQDQQRSRDAGYETHLTKPVDFNRLLEAIERIASVPSPDRESGDV